MAQKEELKDERPLQSFALKNFLAVNTTNSRTAVPDQAFYDLENVQPVGSANLHSVSDISTVLHDYAGDSIYTDKSVNLSNTEYLIQAATNGKLFAYTVVGGAVTQIANVGVLSGSGTRIVQWKNSTVLIIDANGYFQWTGSGNITTVFGTGLPSNGVAIAVYAGRVWIAQGRVLFYSVPDSFTDFTAANGGGFRNLTDSTLRSTVQALFTANGFLYVFGVTSVDAVSDVYVPSGASPPTPNMTYLNLDAIIGTDQPESICAYGRLVLFANRYGVFSLYGTTIQSISGVDPNNAYQSSIDGTWQYVDFTQVISAGQFVSNNLLCCGFLIRRLNDPIFGTGVVLAVYQGNAAGGRWWFGNSSDTGQATRVSTGFVSATAALYTYIGNKLYRLFSNAASSPAGQVMTALWDFGKPIEQKQTITAGFGITIQQLGTSGVFAFSLDTTAGSTPLTNLAAGAVQWVNNANNVVTWVNNTSQPVTWISGSFLTYWGAANFGFAKYVGFTLKTPIGAIFEINSFLLDYKFAKRWSGN